MKKRCWQILIVSAATLLLLAAPGLAENPPLSVWVDDNFNEETDGWNKTHFKSIQEGVAAVSVGGTVYVASGSYKENVAIAKDNLLVKGDEGAVLDGDNNTGFSITSSGVTIRGFTIENCEEGVLVSGNNNQIKDNVFTANTCGIFNDGVGNRVNYNYISGNTTKGLQTDKELDATMNWWGDISGPSHDSHPSGSGDSIKGNADYDPWLADKKADYSEGMRIMLVQNGVNYARVSFLEDTPFAFPIIITITTGETDGWVALIVCDPAEHEKKGLPDGVDPLLLAGYNLACIESSFDSKDLPVQLEIILVEDTADLEDFDADQLPSDLVKLYRYEDGAWRLLGGTLAVENGKLIFRAEFKGLSLFGIFLQNPPGESGTAPASKTLPRTNGTLPLTGLACMAMLAAAAFLRKKRD